MKAEMKLEGLLTNCFVMHYAFKVSRGVFVFVHLQCCSFVIAYRSELFTS